MNMDLFIVERFEGNWAVIEWGDMTFNVPKAVLPKGIKEGDVLVWNIYIDQQATQYRKRQAEMLAEDIFNEYKE